jgi:hypothetical protein
MEAIFTKCDPFFHLGPMKDDPALHVSGEALDICKYSFFGPTIALKLLRQIPNILLCACMAREETLISII